MALSPALPPGAALPKKMPVAKAKPVAILRSQTPASAVSTPRDDEVELAPADLAARLNWEEKRKYIKEKKIGEGTYANVYKGHLRSDPNTFVAIKKIKYKEEFKDGIAMDAIRECKFLSELSHPHIIHLLGVFSSKDQNVNLVLEFLPMGDLEQIIRHKDEVRYGPPDIKAWMGMINQAVWWCHENFVLHRDIKPNNIFVAANGALKLADFGLARSYADPQENRIMTSNVITLWYRPLELLYQAPWYSGKVDIWSVACVHAELLMGTPFLVAETEIAMMTLIAQVFGDPTDKNWPGVSKMPQYKVINKNKKEFQPLSSKAQLMANWRTSDPDEGDLLFGMFQLDPRKRLSAREILEHPYWKAAPRPTKTENLPKRGGGESRLAEDMKRKAGDISTERADKVARKLDFGQGK